MLMFRVDDMTCGRCWRRMLLRLTQAGGVSRTGSGSHCITAVQRWSGAQLSGRERLRHRTSGARLQSTLTVRSRSAFAMTLTEESAIAAAATTGDSSSPKNG